MDADKIRTALGQLQVEPEAREAWAALEQEVVAESSDDERSDMTRLLESARRRHTERGEWEAVAAMLELEIALARPAEQAGELLRQLIQVQQTELYDSNAADRVCQRLNALVPGDRVASSVLADNEEKRARWEELCSAYRSEAEDAPDDVYKSSMLMRAAEMELRYAGDTVDRDSIIEGLAQACRLDPSNAQAGRILERLYRHALRYEDAARVLEKLASRSESGAHRVQAAVRLARMSMRRLQDSETAIRAYEHVLDDVPEHQEAMEFLAGVYAEEERWQELVNLFEKELKIKDLSNAERLGDMLQIAMLHWKKLQHPRAAEPWFERIRQLDPAHETVLAFYRDYCQKLDDDARLLQVLQSAQRVMSEGPQKAAIASELARLAEGQENAQKAIEQYKSVLRQDADNEEARVALKRLYTQTQGYNALVELLRQQLERTDAKDYETRLAILREVAGVYRTYIKSDTALVSVLNQIVQLDDKLDEQDVEELRELIALYDKLGRWRDLLTFQLKLAEVAPDIEEKKALYRAAARRWLDQFSNFQHATEAYEALIKIAPEDKEARERLQELYRKRRAWPALYALFEDELERVEGAEQISLMKDMAQLAAERLNRGQEAVKLYRRILELEPGRRDVLDSLERYAERNKDWPTLADALERRVGLLDDPGAKAVVLQKLGLLYGEHLQDAGRSVQTWKRVLDLQPGHHRALRVLRDSLIEATDFDGLEELYGSQGDFEALAEVLSNAADRATDTETKVELSYRAARVYEERLEQPDRSFRSYERVLAARPDDARAARALIPLYEADEKWARLPALYELLLETASPDEKLELLGKLVEVSGQRLSDRKAAVGYARQAYALAPTSEVAFQLLERAAAAASTPLEFAQALEARLCELSREASPQQEPAPAGQEGAKPRRRKRGRKASADAEPANAAAASQPKQAVAASAEEKRALTLTLATLYDQELSRTDDAVAFYRELLTQRADDEEVRAALEALLWRDERREDLRWLFGLRVDHASSDAERVSLLLHWANLEEDAFEAPDRSVALLARIIELDATHDAALRELVRLHLAAESFEAAAAVLERRSALLEGPERAATLTLLAELCATKLARPEQALDVAGQVLEADSTSKRALAVVEQLLDVEAVREKAARALAERYATGGEARREAQALEVLLEQATDSKERYELFWRLASVQREKLKAVGAALDVTLRALREFPKSIDLWESADGLAAQAGRPTELADALREVLRGDLDDEVRLQLSERAAIVHAERLGDPVGAVPHLQKVLELDPSSESAFDRLRDILTGAERWGELEALYLVAVGSADNAGRKIELLIEVALICEEIIEEPTKTTQHYESILALDPIHALALESLDRLYERQERYQELAGLLAKRVEIATGDATGDLALRLARLQLEHLHEPSEAMARVEEVLRERPNDYAARELAERLLEIGSVRGRAALALEAVYEARDEVRDLVRVLLARVQASKEGEQPLEDAERVEILRRIATLRDERLHDDRAAFDSFAALVPEQPSDAHTRNRLLDIGRRLAEHERVAEVLGLAAAAADSNRIKGEILTQRALVEQELMSDVDRAEASYRQVLALDAADEDLVLPAAQALQRIYRAQGNAERLAEVLHFQVKLQSDIELRRDLLAELGELCEHALDDPEGAIAAWKLRTEDEPGDSRALAALDGLYEKRAEWSALVAVLERRRDLADDGESRRELMQRIAKTQGEHLANASSAIDAWQALVAEFGPNDEYLAALERWFESSARWDELSETYEKHLEIAGPDAERLSLLAALGELRVQRQNDPAGALEAFRNALTLDPSHESSRNAVSQMLQSDDAQTRREAAEILRPVLESEGNHSELLRVIEIEVDATDDPLTRMDHLSAALAVAEGPLGDNDRALTLASRAVREAVGHGELSRWLEQVERLAEATGKRKEQVELLMKIVGDIFDGDVQLDVTLRVAELAQSQLSDDELASQFFQRALDLRADEPRALVALDGLCQRAGDSPRLLEILDRRIETAEGDDERKQLGYRRAKLLAEKLDDRPRAIETYEMILDIALDSEAMNALESLYTAEERWTDLVELYQRQLGADFGGKPEILVNIAKVASQHQRDVSRALDELEQALSLQAQHPLAVTELERLMAGANEAEHRARAAGLLEVVYTQRGDFKALGDAITVRLEHSGDVDERRALLARLAKLHEEQSEDYEAALETTARLFHEDIGAPDVRDELERLANVAGAERRLAEIYESELESAAVEEPTTATLARRVGQLRVALGEPEAALVYYRRALSFEPESRELFQDVDAILEQAKRHGERVELYREALEHRFEPDDRLALLHEIASLQRDRLDQADQAIATYREALELEESDEVSNDALTELYRQGQRWDELAELLQRRAEYGLDARRAVEFRLRLAKLLRGELANPERAIEQLEEILRVEPTDAAAIEELESLREAGIEKRRVVEILRPLYEAADDWQHQVALNEDRFELAEDIPEQVAVLQETARLFETRGQSPAKARKALQAAVQLEPEASDTRGDFERLVEQTEAWVELVDTYEGVIASHPDLLNRYELVARCAQVLDEKLDDPRRALAGYSALHRLDDTAIEPLLKMERLATLLSDWSVLVDALSRKAELVLDDEERASTWRRVGEARRDMLDDLPGAIAGYERAFELEPTSAFTADCLIELLERAEQHERLVELYQRRVELADEADNELQYALLHSAANVLEEKLRDPLRASESLNQALSVRPGDPPTLSALARIFRAEAMWPDLLECLTQLVSATDEPEARATLRREMAEVLAERQQAFEEALHVYRDVLQDVGDDLDTIVAVRRIGQEHEELRELVADILVPVLAEQARFEPLVNVLELRLTVEHEPAKRVDTLREIAATQEKHLESSADALGAILRALGEEPSSVELHVEAERLAGACDGWQPYADALSERAAATFEPDIASELWIRLGKVAEERLGDARRAVHAFGKALEQSGEQPELLAALDRLYTRLEEYQLLSEVIERRTIAEDSDEVLTDLFYRLARLQLEQFSEPSRALSALRTVLERSPAHDAALELMVAITSHRDLFDEAAEVLEAVYRSRGMTMRLAALYEQRVGFAVSPEERVEMRRNLSRVLEEDCQDPAAAQRVAQQGLRDAISDELLLMEIERLAEITGDWKAAAVALREALDGADELPLDLGRDLSLRCATWERDRAGDSEAAVEALRRALSYDPTNDDVLHQLELLQRVEGKERELIETLRRRARLQLDDLERFRLVEEAKGLADSLQDAQLAEDLLRELLDADPANLWALRELTEIRRRAGDPRQTFELLLRRVEIEVAGDVVRELRYEAAALAAGELSNLPEAVEIYQTLYDEEPTDARAPEMLRGIFTKTEDWPQLTTLLERLLERAEGPEESARLRLELAELADLRGNDPERAIELLGALLDDQPGHAQAVVALSSLYEKTKRDGELAQLLDSQIAEAAARGDVPAELSFLVRLGEICTTRLEDRDRAIVTYNAVLARQADHEGALKALLALHEEAQEHLRAAEVLRRLVELADGEERRILLLRAANSEQSSGNVDGAIEALQRALAMDEADLGVRRRLRELYEAREVWDKLAELVAGDAGHISDEAEKVRLLLEAATIHAEKRQDAAAEADLLERASRFRPDDREILLRLCDAHSASGRGDAAAQVLEQIVASYGGRRSKELGEIHRRLANAYLAMGNSERALEELDKAFRIEPGNVGVLKRLGEVALETGDLKKAQQMFRALLLQRLDANSPITKAEVFASLGEVHYQLGEKPKATQMFERALQQDASLEAAASRLAELKA